MQLRLLLVETDQDLRETLCDLLAGVGFTVVPAGSSGAAVAALAGERFDVVLTDFALEHRDVETNWSVIDDLAQRARPTPIVLMTGWNFRAGELDGRPVAALVRKPFDVDTVVRTLSGCLDLPRLADASVGRLETYFAALGAHDWDGLVAGCTEDVLYNLPADDERFGRRVRGRAALHALAATTFEDFPEAHFTVGTMRALPRGALVEYVGRWRGPTGEPVELAGAVVFAFDGNLIAEIGIRIDVGRLNALMT